MLYRCACRVGSVRLAASKRPWLRLFSCSSWLLAGLLLSAGDADAAGLKAGDLLVADSGGGPAHQGALVVVDAVTGNRTVLSDFGNPAQGAIADFDLTGVTIGRAGEIFVSRLFGGVPDGGAIFRVDADTGNRTLFSNFGALPRQGYLYYGLAVDAFGWVLANAQGPTNGVVRVNATTGASVLVSDLFVPGKGAVFTSTSFVTDLAFEPSGNILFGAEIVSEDYSSIDAALFRVDARSGRRQLLSDLGEPAQGEVGDLWFSTGIAVENSGDILVASGGSIYAPRNLLFRIDPESGNRTIVSDFDDPAQGPVGLSLRGLEVEPSGQIIIGSGDAATGSADTLMLFRVDPVTGQRTLLSDPHNPAQGLAFRGITYIERVPENGSLMP